MDRGKTQGRRIQAVPKTDTKTNSGHGSKGGTQSPKPGSPMPGKGNSPKR